MRVCYFGSYSRSYSANRIMIKGLRINNVEVIECHTTSAFPTKYVRLARKHSRLSEYDIIIVGFPGHTCVPLAKLVTKTPVVFYAFLSLYDSLVFDRRTVRHPAGIKLNYLLDKYSCKLSDIVILDTNQHINYFCNQFGLKKEKFKRSYVGADDQYFYPRNIDRENQNEFIVFFYGSFTPLHGIEIIIQAAKILEKWKDIKFELVGSGQTFMLIRKVAKKLKLKNVHFKGKIPYEELPIHMAKADISLGIFGRTAKAKRVVPNKVYDALASKKAVVTGYSPAIREILTHGKNVYLCKMSDPKDLAEAILIMKKDDNLRKNIAEEGYKLFNRCLSPKIIGKNVKNLLEKL